jgi:flagella basal body P-ring formation protein FlgA
MIEPMVNESITIRCPALGWRLRVSVAVSQTESAQVLVRRGESIEVVYPGNGFSISGMGLALDDGEEGKSVRVKISTSSAPVTAIVTGAGVATVSH